ncbi:MAG: helix-turn-helix domain-containing protein [bacterium]
MNKHFQSILKDLGLSEPEARVYEALLDLGISVVTPVAALAKVNRTTCYNILESLSVKKLVSKTMYRGKQSYGAEDPNKIIANLEDQKRQIEISLQNAKSFQPEMARLFAQKYIKPIIKYVEGKDGIIELYEDSLRCENKKEGIRAYTSLRDLREELGEYPDWYFTERTRREIPIRSMVPDTEYGKEVKRSAKEYLREVRLLPKEKFDFSPEIYLYDNKFSVMSFKEKFGFLLESKEIVDALKIAWELAWERSKDYDRIIKFEKEW